MGHGDELIADRNFRHINRLADLLSNDSNAGIQRPAIKTITSLPPLDGFVDHAAVRMEIDGAPEGMNETHTAVFSFLSRHPKGAGLGHIPRPAFYEGRVVPMR